MRGLATAIMLTGLLWEAYWMARIAWGAQGTLPLLAFVGGLLAIASSTAYLSQPARSPAHQRRNGHQPYYGRTWPATRRAR
ncbi:MAG: hypothetical protein A2W34_04030 [Chloroflexi bacterium RBG_16_64_32]|nr:MAG: hypothetical protein A2W34_04030 [Chloroflexi bacterium RBG_16_64_32]